MKTVSSWISSSNETLNIKDPPLPTPETGLIHTPNYSLDGAFVLGKGFVHLDDEPFLTCFNHFPSPGRFYLQQLREQYPQSRWILTDRPDGNLLFLFILLTHAIGNNFLYWLNQKSLPLTRRTPLNSVKFKWFKFCQCIILLKKQVAEEVHESSEIAAYKELHRNVTQTSQDRDTFKQAKNT